MSQTAVRTVEIDNLGDYVNAIDSLLREWVREDCGLWMRGVPNIRYETVPGVVWRGIDDEVSVVDEFLISYQPLTDFSPRSNWELYALMQHYGLPTRLLDWTRSPLIALYFAVEQPVSSDSVRAVWGIDPFQLNKINTGIGYVPVPGVRYAGRGVYLDPYLPLPLRQDTPTAAGKHEHPPATSALEIESLHDTPPAIPEAPVAIEPPMSNRRILAQQGCFTMHGSSSVPVTSYFCSPEVKDPHVVLFTISGEKKRNQLLSALYNLGIREELIYQDLASLSRRIVREEWGFSTSPRPRRIVEPILKLLD